MRVNSNTQHVEAICSGLKPHETEQSQAGAFRPSATKDMSVIEQNCSYPLLIRSAGPPQSRSYREESQT